MFLRKQLVHKSSNFNWNIFLTRLILVRISTNDKFFMPIEVPYHLIQSAREGDKQSFGKLIDCCSQYVYGVSLKMIGDVDDARDVAQESFIKVWEKINTYNNHFKFTTWLYKIVINTCLDKLRQRSRDKQIFQQSYGLENLHMSSLVNSKVEFEEKQFVEFIRMISGRLSGKQHSVFVLHDLEELTQEEISKILKMSKGSVKSNLHHARKAVRQILISIDSQIITSNYEM